jgi:VIT1/CCC1 family predicted Fe2+/Mn2+ transporter
MQIYWYIRFPTNPTDADGCQQLLKADNSFSHFSAATGSYLEQEQAIFEQLKSLVLQASWLKSHIASSLIITKEMVQVWNHVCGIDTLLNSQQNPA